MASENSQFQQVLMQTGLNGSQALVYETLLKTGSLKASYLANHTPFKRQLTYKLLDELVELGLVIRNQDKKVIRFEAAHPVALKEYIRKQQEQTKTADQLISGVLPTLSSIYNLALGKPGVSYFEGIDGIKHIFDLSLQASTEILQYHDPQKAIQTHPELNTYFTTQRQARKIKKRIIAPDTEFMRKRSLTYNRAITELRLVPGVTFPTTMLIYDSCVSIATLDSERIISVHIEDPKIAEMHRTLFNLTWNHAIAPNT